MILKYISGPLIGAVIGYFTNYLAVKMLFFPKKEVRVFGHRLPMTPGAIPKGKPRLARAVGNVVGGTLLTGEDITGQLLTEEMETKLTDEVMDFLSKEIRREVCLLSDSGEQTYERAKEKAADMLCEQAMAVIEEMQLGSLIAEKGKEAVMEKLKGSMLEMFLSENRVASLIGPAAEKIEQYIRENGAEYIRPALEEKLEDFGDRTALELLEEMDIDQARTRRKIQAVYEKAVQEGVQKLLVRINIAGVVEEKINAMDVGELEQIVLSVMKKELDLIVNLGALIGLILGTINIFL